MDFPLFLEKLRQMKELGWQAGLIDVPCPDFPEHNHLRLRLKQPHRDRLHFSPVEAMMFVHHCTCEEQLNYSDRNFTLHGIKMASEYIDWYRGGNGLYVHARLEMLEIFGITEKDVRTLAPTSRSRGAE